MLTFYTSDLFRLKVVWSRLDEYRIPVELALVNSGSISVALPFTGRRVNASRMTLLLERATLPVLGTLVSSAVSRHRKREVHDDDDVILEWATRVQQLAKNVLSGYDTHASGSHGDDRDVGDVEEYGGAGDYGGGDYGGGGSGGGSGGDRGVPSDRSEDDGDIAADGASRLDVILTDPRELSNTLMGHAGVEGAITRLRT